MRIPCHQIGSVRGGRVQLTKQLLQVSHRHRTNPPFHLLNPHQHHPIFHSTRLLIQGSLAKCSQSLRLTSPQRFLNSEDSLVTCVAVHRHGKGSNSLTSKNR